jgi:predicted TIM-barrel fold metal-dependent hydrolase
MIIDANAQFGFDRLENTRMDPESILGLMDHSKIDKAIITCNECMYYDFTEGNNQTAEQVKAHSDRFIGFFGLHPARYIGVVEEVDRAVHDLGLAGFRIFFTEVSFGRGWSSGLRSLVLERVMKRVDELSLPVFLEAGFPFAEIKAFAEKYPRARFMASGAGYANMAEAIVAAQMLDNLYLEISTLDAGDGIGFLVRELGSRKLVFGTSIPFSAGSVARLNVEHSGISQEDKENIYHKNVEAILRRGR